LQSKFVAEQLAAMPADAEELNSGIERGVGAGQLMKSSAGRPNQ
jgi:hypothetical protein